MNEKLRKAMEEAPIPFSEERNAGFREGWKAAVSYLHPEMVKLAVELQGAANIIRGEGAVLEYNGDEEAANRLYLKSDHYGALAKRILEGAHE